MTEPVGWLLASVPESGGYFSTFKIVSILVLALPWLYALPWINKDSAKVHLLQAAWSWGALGAGLAGLLLWLLLPLYGVGLAAYLVLAGTSVVGYVVLRNRRVRADARVLTGDHLRKLLRGGKGSKAVEVVQRVKLYDSLRRPVFAPAEDEPELRQAFNYAQNFLHNVVQFRASEVDLVPAGGECAVRFLVDGVIHPRPPADAGDAEMLIDYLKGIAGMNVEDKRHPQTGKIALEAGAVGVDVNVATAGTKEGQRLQLRIVQEAVRTRLEDLGLRDDLRQRLEEINASDHGLIIVSGPRGNGVTSTLYSLLRRQDAFMKQLVTLEAKAQVDMENITQVAYRDQTDLTAQLGKTLRRDPDVVMVDACETAQAAALILEAVESKNVLLGINADNALTALAKWVKTVGDARTAVSPVKAVTCQVLLRKLCPSCRQEYRPAKDLLAKLNLPAEKIELFYRPHAPDTPRLDEKGKPLVDGNGRPIPCPTCRGTGYYQRTAAFELLEMNDEIRDLIVRGGSLSDIRAACRKHRMRSLQEQSLRKVIEGLTSIEEVVRVSRATRT